jgi:chromosome segregation ATPase
VDEPEHASPPDHDSGASLIDRLATRLGEMRAQLVAILPEGEEALRNAQEAAEEARAREERIGTLERLLAAARQQQEDLTAQIVRDQSVIEDLQSRKEELTDMVARLVEFERGRAAAEARATEAERRADRVEVELSGLRDDLQRTRTRVSELESDLSAAAVEVAAGATARATAQRLAMQRDEARERAEAERRMAAADRVRADEAERRLAELESRTVTVVQGRPTPEPETRVGAERPPIPPLERDRGPWFREGPGDVVDVRESEQDEEQEDEPLPNDPRYWS